MRKVCSSSCKALMLVLSATGALLTGSASARATCKPERECIKPKQEEVKGPTSVKTEPARRTRSAI